MPMRSLDRVRATLALIKLISFDPGVEAKAAGLKGRDRDLDAAPLTKTSGVVGELARLNPAVLVLDLDRLPSHAREIAFALRTSKSARHIPILFAGGQPEKIARIRTDFPDAAFAPWPEASAALSLVVATPRTAPVHVPQPRVYTTSLAQKLGIRPQMQIALLGAPDGFEELLGDLPEGAAFAGRLTAVARLALCFVRSREDLAAALDLFTLRLPVSASFWIVYPKRSGPRRADFHENDVRNAGLAAGFVDYKTCSLDAEWSAVKFARRKL
jgi:hypothetical protein